MSLHPAYDALRKHRIRFFTNTRDWTDDCECGGKNSLFVHYDDDVAEFHCTACGRSGSERLRPERAKPDGNGNDAQRVDAIQQRKLEEAMRAFDPEPQNLEEAIEQTKSDDFPEDDEPEQETAPGNQSDNITLKTESEPEPADDTHIWRSENHDYPCTPTGRVA